MWLLVFIALRIVAFLVGLLLVIYTINSVIRTFVLPRGAPDPLTGFVFNRIRRLFDIRATAARDYATRDRLMALYAPVSLLALLPTWLLIILAGYTAMFWSLRGTSTWYNAFVLSGSALFTLGFERVEGVATMFLIFTEAGLGMLLVALLIGYLPTMYSSFQQRERAVNLLEVRASKPPSAVELLTRFHRLDRLPEMHEHWEMWEAWFGELQESHTSLAPLVFFRSHDPEMSWVTAAGAVLDAAALLDAVVDVPRDIASNLCLRAGYVALNAIADYFDLDHAKQPAFPDVPISISRQEFDEACVALEAAGIALRADRDDAWQQFAGWRVNYDQALIQLARLTAAPYAPWSSDRSLLGMG